MIRSQTEWATILQDCLIVDNDLPAKDLHGKPDNYFNDPVQQNLKFFVNISNGGQASNGNAFER